MKHSPMLGIAAAMQALMLRHPDSVSDFTLRPDILEPTPTLTFLPGLGMGKFGNRIGPGRPSLRKNWPGNRNREWVPMGGARECARRRRQMGLDH